MSFEPNETWAVWEPAVSGWLADIARWVHEEVPFEVAIIGGEPAPDTAPRPVTHDEIPDERGVAYLLPDEGGTLPWYPITAW